MRGRNHAARTGAWRAEPVPKADSLIEGEIAQFDESLWQAIPQAIKNQFPQARGNWFQRKDGACVFAVAMSRADGERFIALVLAWISGEGVNLK